MRLTVKTSLLALVGILIALTIGLGSTAYVKLGSMQGATADISENWLPSVRALAEIKYEITRYRLYGTRHVLSTDDAEMKKLDDQIGELVMRMERDFKAYEKLISSPEEKGIWDGFKEKWDTYKASQVTALDFSRRNENEKAATAFGVTSALFNNALADLDADVELNDKGAKDATAFAGTTYNGAVLVVALVAGAALVIGFAAGGFVLFGVTRPLDRLTVAMTAVSGGNLSAEIPSTSTQNEIGDMARALVVFRDGLAETERLRAAQAEREAEAARRLTAERHEIADRFMATMGALAESFVHSSGEVADAAKSLSATAEETSRQAAAVASAAEEASSNVQTVAASTEELAASVREISGQVGHSTQVAGSAATEAAKTEVNIRALSEAAEKIGDVVNLIKDIAGQTNLLALNATIEAARAGEAGKGFAVVASEVKQLAAQTAKATDEIGAKIGEIQGATSETVASIGRIVGIIGSIREVTSSIAGAVEQQSAATQEISGNTHRAAEGASHVTDNISGVGRAAEMTGAAATQLMGLSGTLSGKADELTRQVNSFVTTLRSA